MIKGTIMVLAALSLMLFLISKLAAVSEAQQIYVVISVAVTITAAFLLGIGISLIEE